MRFSLHGISLVFALSLVCGSGAAPHELEARAASPHLVFAHHIIGNTYPYTLDTWKNDIRIAQAVGIDAFALNFGTTEWQPNRIKLAYEAAQDLGTGFKLFFSLDTTELPCSEAKDITYMRTFVSQYVNHPSQLKYNGKVFLSTFSGEHCKFGQATVAQGWQSLLASLGGTNSIFFVPNFSLETTVLDSMGLSSIMNGIFYWISAWPVEATSQNLLSLAGLPAGSSKGAAVQKIIGSTKLESQYFNTYTGGNKVYMGAASPWLFTHYSPQTYNKNFVYLSENLYPKRWNNIIAARDHIHMIELTCWNDYGESTYVGPIEGGIPKGSEAWVMGMSHLPFLHMTKYYTTAYKTGTYPPITKDTVYIWARPHPKNAVAPDPVPKPTGWELNEDNMFAMVHATQSATLIIRTSSKNSKAFTVPAGESQYIIPLSAGDTMQATLLRGGKAVVDVHPTNFLFNPSPKTYNYNVFASMNCTGGQCW